MWKVTNNKNKEHLDKFHSQIALPLFDLILYLKENTISINSFKDFEKESTSVLGSNFPKIIFKKKYKKQECFKLILDVVKTNTLNELKAQKELFLEQNRNINLGIYAIYPKSVPAELYRIFSNILYDQCFDDEKCWNYIKAGFKFDRLLFHDNFKGENDDRTICSLCDIDTVIAKSNSVVEHFLPRNMFPYLSLNANNLTSCCSGCNLGEEGKGVKFLSPMMSPFLKQIGDNVKFVIESDKIVVSSREKNMAINNYIEMMQLNKRFSVKTVYNASLIRLNNEISMHNRMIGRFDVDELLEFFIDELENRKKEGLYFFKKHYFGENYEEYLEELNLITH